MDLVDENERRIISSDAPHISVLSLRKKEEKSASELLYLLILQMHYFSCPNFEANLVSTFLNRLFLVIEIYLTFSFLFKTLAFFNVFLT